ncbi:hypothetical protein KJ678_02120 [Patescibacteria group bacterium]|nr:hypothetical protein [Patescibacteria group bacterium]
MPKLLGLNGGTNRPSIKEAKVKKFEKLLEGIRTEEVRDAIECVHTECGRGMRRTLILVGVLAVVLAILAALAFAGFKAVDIILTNIGQRLDAVATIPLVGGVDERVSELERLQAADSSTMGGVYAEVQILWDEHIALTPTPEPASVPAPTTAPSVVEEARQVLGTLYGGYYDPMWEYLEYGETVEYFRPVEVSLSWMEGESSAHKSFLLTPPQWRALEQKLKDRKWEYFSKFEVIFEGDNLLTVLDPETGDLIWDASMAKGPRPLNSLEQWYMDYLMFNGWDFEVADVFDTFPKCERNSFGNERCGNIEGWSPAEIVARGTAFENHAENPDNGVWVEEWRSVDPQCGDFSKSFRK